jgi:hypothetical protein
VCEAAHSTAPTASEQDPLRYPDTARRDCSTSVVAVVAPTVSTGSERAAARRHGPVSSPISGSAASLTVGPSGGTGWRGLPCRGCGSRRCACCRPDPRRPARIPGSRSRGRAATPVDAHLAAGPDELQQRRRPSAATDEGLLLLVHSTSPALAASRARVAGGAEEPLLARGIRSSKRRRHDAYAAPRRRRTRATRQLSLRLRERLCLPARTPRCRSSSTPVAPRAWCPRSGRSSNAGVSRPTPPQLAPPPAGL